MNYLQGAYQGAQNYWEQLPQYVDKAYQGAQNYWEQLPQDVGKQMLYSFALAGVIVTIVKNNPSDGIRNGILSAVATAIHALVTPIFKKVIGERRNLSFNEEFCRTFIALVTTGYISLAFGYPEIIQGLFVLSIFNLILIDRNPGRHNINQSAFVIV